MRDDNGRGYKSTCANEETVNEMGLPQMRELAYELSTKWAWVVGPGLGRIWLGLGHPGLAVHASCCVRPGCYVGWAAGAPVLGWSAWARLAGSRAGRRRSWSKEERRKEKEKKEKEERKEREREKKRERLVKEREKEKKELEILGLKSRLYSVSGFQSKISFSIDLRRNFIFKKDCFLKLKIYSKF